MNGFVTALLLSEAMALSDPLPGPMPPQDDVLQRVERITANLLPANVIRGGASRGLKLADRMEHYGTPGVSIAVINGFAIEWARGYGTLALDSPDAVTAQTLFQVASISKPVAAVGALRLVQEGRLKLDEDVNDRLKSWKVPENEFTQERKVTLRGLLTHTAGFDMFPYEGSRASEPLPTVLQVLDGAAPATNPPVRVVHRPGSRVVYSGGGFLVLQQLLVDVTQTPFPDLMLDRVFRPLEMRDSTFQHPLPEDLRPRAASGTQRGEPVEGRWLIKPNMASGGLWSTASDIARLLIELQKARLGESARVLTQQTVNLMLPPDESPVFGDGSDSVLVRGMGFGVAGDGPTFRFSHGGYTTGYRAEAIAFGDGRGVVILTNGSSQALLREIIRSIATEYQWQVPEYLPIQRSLANVDAHLLNDYVGRYEFPEGRNPRISAVTVTDGVLHLDGEPLRAESESSFFGEGEATYTFVRDEQGNVIEMVYDVRIFKLTARKLKE